MLEKFDNNDELKFKDLSQEEKTARGILGRLYGPCASTIKATRNGRYYSDELWQKVFENPINKELLARGGIPGELDHPADRLETDSSKIAIMMPEAPKKDKEGHLIGYWDIIDTPCGNIAYALAKYGFQLGISSRGNGETYALNDGNEGVDPDTYEFSAFDLVLIPACADARLSLVTESLDTKKVALKKALQESLAKASEADRNVMEKTLEDLNIDYKDEDRASHYIIGGYKNAKDPALKKDMKAVKDFGVKCFSEEIGDGYQLVLEGPKDKLKDVVTNYFGLDFTSVDDIFNESKPRGDGKYVPVSELKAGDVIQKTNGDLVKILKIDFYPDIDEAYALVKEKVSGREITYHLYMPITNSEKCVYDASIFDTLDEASSGAANDAGAQLLKSLQEALLAKEQADSKITQLQEKLSVCYAKEASFEDDLSKYKTLVRNLSEKAQKTKDLEQQIKVLNEQLAEKQGELDRRDNKVKRISAHQALIESKQSDLNKTLSVKLKQLNEANRKIVTLTEQLNESKVKQAQSNKTLTENYETLKKDFKLKQDEYSSKLEKANNLVEQYKRTAAKAVNQYIQSKARFLGVSANTIKEKLPENYSFTDIDNICESLKEYNLQFQSLPFNVSNIKKVSITESKKLDDNLFKNPLDDGDDVDEGLIRLANKMMNN